MKNVDGRRHVCECVCASYLCVPHGHHKDALHWSLVLGFPQHHNHRCYISTFGALFWSLECAAIHTVTSFDCNLVRWLHASFHANVPIMIIIAVVGCCCCCSALVSSELWAHIISCACVCVCVSVVLCSGAERRESARCAPSSQRTKITFRCLFVCFRLSSSSSSQNIYMKRTSAAADK